ncbi:ribonuclease P protein component [Halosquirtibacter laminarini]|uniref:Ribonuclease P protein component n=1 Tax=Halosquirtibacter laminarini TaxID=3374600 RepID=A0AC61NKA7_9BACT|nr:ribonuclease P protein component [Prolixibacteraceae bacterium]
MNKNTFKKQERLCSKKVIEEMFTEGHSTLCFPIKAVYLSDSINVEKDTPVQCAFTVPKRLFKRANKRNLLKRRMKESYRLNKSSLDLHSESLSIMFIYIAKEELPYSRIESAVKKVIRKISDSQQDKKR